MRKIPTPDGEVYTFPSRDKIGGPKKGEWGAEFPFVDGGPKTNTTSAGSSSMKEERSERSSSEESRREIRKESRGIKDEIRVRAICRLGLWRNVDQKPTMRGMPRGGRKRDNSKAKFTQWVMQRAMGTLFGFADNLAIVSTQREKYQSEEWHFESS